MIRLGNLSGTIMFQNQPLLYFKLERGYLVDCKLLCEDSKLLPLEFKDKVINERRIHLFWEARVTPDTRQFLKEDMEAEGLEYYNVEQLIRFQKGRCVDDNYWLDDTNNYL